MAETFHVQRPWLTPTAYRFYARRSSSPINLAELYTFVRELEHTTDLVGRLRAKIQ